MMGLSPYDSNGSGERSIPTISQEGTSQSNISAEVPGNLPLAAIYAGIANSPMLHLVHAASSSLVGMQEFLL